MFDAERAMTGWVVNLFADIEQRYIEHYEKDMGKSVFTVGPACLANCDDDDTLEHGHDGEADTAAEATHVLRWLDTKPARSVVYVCFGSPTRFPWDQVAELGMGLADSGANFVWVVRDKNASPPLPNIDDTAPGHGLVVRGWASQVAVLRHAAVGAFMTHCGWGVVTEAAGRPGASVVGVRGAVLQRGAGGVAHGHGRLHGRGEGVRVGRRGAGRGGGQGGSGLTCWTHQLARSTTTPCQYW